jgi:hypothetical protein
VWKRFLLEENLELELEKVEGKGEGEWIERELLCERRLIPEQKQEWVEGGGGGGDGRRERDMTAIVEIESELWRKRLLIKLSRKVIIMICSWY